MLGRVEPGGISSSATRRLLAVPDLRMKGSVTATRGQPRRFRREERFAAFRPLVVKVWPAVHLPGEVTHLLPEEVALSMELLALRFFRLVFSSP